MCALPLKKEKKKKRILSALPSCHLRETATGKKYGYFGQSPPVGSIEHMANRQIQRNQNEWMNDELVSNQKTKIKRLYLHQHGDRAVSKEERYIID